MLLGITGCGAMDNNSISIVMTYYNRKNLLLRTLQSLTQSAVKDFDVIVVDDASDEDQCITEIVTMFPFKITLVQINKQDKTWKNPCMAYNIGFSKITGGITVVQNAECIHMYDVLLDIKNRCSYNNYISYSCYSLDEKITNLLRNVHFGSSLANKELEDIISPLSPTLASLDNLLGWYNHPKYRPVGYHFVAAILTHNLKKLNGFDEKYANDLCFDDDEFLRRVKYLKLRVDIPNGDLGSPLVLHQYHHKNIYKGCSQYNNSLFIRTRNNRNVRANIGKAIL